MTTRRSLSTRRTLATVLVPLALLLGACSSGDDGGEVRNIDGTVSGSSGSGSGGSGSGESGSGAASGSSSEAASGHSDAECVPVGSLADASILVDVELTEWRVTPTVDSVASGMVGFNATNTGEHAHEIVIIKGESFESLPMAADGGVDEAQLPDGAVIGEIEAFPAGESCTGVFDLAPGTYVLVCNIVETHDGETEDHAKLGMHTVLTVT